MENGKADIGGRASELAVLAGIISDAEKVLPYCPDYGFLEGLASVLEYCYELFESAAGAACAAMGACGCDCGPSAEEAPC